MGYMASIQRQGDRYRAQGKIYGRRASKVFKALVWAQEQEVQLSGAKLPDKTFAEACKPFRLRSSEPRGARVVACVERSGRYQSGNGLALAQGAGHDAGHVARDAGRLQYVAGARAVPREGAAHRCNRYPTDKRMRKVG